MRTMFDSKMISLIISDYVLIVPTLHHEFCLRTIKVSLVDFFYAYKMYITLIELDMKMLYGIILYKQISYMVGSFYLG